MVAAKYVNFVIMMALWSLVSRVKIIILAHIINYSELFRIIVSYLQV